MQFDLTVGDQPTETTDEDELVHAAGAVAVKPPPPKAPHRRHSDSPDFGREPLGGKQHNKLAAPPRFAGEVVGPASDPSLTGPAHGPKRSPKNSTAHKTAPQPPPGLAGKPTQAPTPLPKSGMVQMHAPNLLNSLQAPEAPPSTSTESHMHPSPPWLQSLQNDLQRLVLQQDSLLQELNNCATTTRKNSECIHTLQTRSEAHERLHAEAESRITKLEREVAEIRSRPVSPYTPRGGMGTPRGQGSTTASSAGGRPIDDFQLVVGGFVNARRIELQEEIRQFFEKHSVPQVLKEVHVPYLRSNIARIELNFPHSADVSQRRQIQAQVLQVLKENYETSLPNQDTNKLWFQRNRSPEDRQMIRSILRTKDIMQSLAQPDSRTEFEWRGRVYLDGENVLFHVSQRPATGEHYLLSDVRGSHNGWYVDVSLVARLLGRSTHDILQSCEA